MKKEGEQDLKDEDLENEVDFQGENEDWENDVDFENVDGQEK